MPPSFPACPEPLLRKTPLSWLKSWRFPVPGWVRAPRVRALPSRPVELCAGPRPPRDGETNTGLADASQEAEPQSPGSVPDTGDRPGVGAPSTGCGPLSRGAAAPLASEHLSPPGRQQLGGADASCTQRGGAAARFVPSETPSRPLVSPDPGGS